MKNLLKIILSYLIISFNTFAISLESKSDVSLKIGVLAPFSGEFKDLGETVLLRVWNDTAWFHAMHLHGQHFWVESNEFGDVSRPLLRDTYLMKPGEKADLIFLSTKLAGKIFNMSKKRNKIKINIIVT